MCEERKWKEKAHVLRRNPNIRAELEELSRTELLFVLGFVLAVKSLIILIRRPY